MKKEMAIVLAALLIFLTACYDGMSTSGNGDLSNVTLILNGEKLDVYTGHYFQHEENLEIPLSAFLSSVGAEYADSAANKYGSQCYSVMANRYVIVSDLHLFMPEADYLELLTRSEAEGKTLTRENTGDLGLLPRNNSLVLAEKDQSGETYSGIWVDEISLMRALRESGIEITIAYDAAANTLYVTLPVAE